MVCSSSFQLFTWALVCLSVCLPERKGRGGRASRIAGLSELPISSLRHPGPIVSLGVHVGPEPSPLRVCSLPSLCSSPLFLCHPNRSTVAFPCARCFIVPFPWGSKFHTNVEGSTMDPPRAPGGFLFPLWIEETRLPLCDFSLPPPLSLAPPLTLLVSPSFPCSSKACQVGQLSLPVPP